MSTQNTWALMFTVGLFLAKEGGTAQLSFRGQMAKHTTVHLYHGRILLRIRKKLAIETQPHGWISRDYAERGKKNQSQRLHTLRFHLCNIL